MVDAVAVLPHGSLQVHKMVDDAAVTAAVGALVAVAGVQIIFPLLGSTVSAPPAAVAAEPYVSSKVLAIAGLPA